MRLIVTGSIAYDYVMVFPGQFQDHILPDKMHVLSVSFLVDSMKRLHGGTAANIAFNLALVGERPELVGAVGQDFEAYRAWLDSRRSGAAASTRPRRRARPRGRRWRAPSRASSTRGWMPATCSGFSTT